MNALTRRRRRPPNPVAGRMRYGKDAIDRQTQFNRPARREENLHCKPLTLHEPSPRRRHRAARLNLLEKFTFAASLVTLTVAPV